MSDQIDIADTRAKKIKKIAKISYRLINEIGFFNFLKLGVSELRKQKLSVFKPEQLPSLLYKILQEDFDRYVQWYSKNDLNEFQVKQLEQKVDNAKFSPKITIVLLSNNLGIDELLQTIDSIKRQYYKKNELCVFASESEITQIKSNTDLSNFKIKFISDKNGFPKPETIQIEKNDYLTILFSGDILHKGALLHLASKLIDNNADFVYSDHDTIENQRRVNPFFKPDWSPNLLLCTNYVSRSFFLKGEIWEKIKEPLSHYDLLLKIDELTEKILHIPLPLFAINKSNNVHYDDFDALASSLKRRDIQAIAEKTNFQNIFKINYKLNSEPKVSIIIPTKDNVKLLKRCISSIKNKTKYKNFEIIIADNGSKKEKTLKYYKTLPYSQVNVSEPFNFSKINNIAAKQATGDYILLLNDDVSALNENWLEHMVSICIQNNIGVVGPRLVLADNTIQHSGIAILPTGAGFHPFMKYLTNKLSYHGLIQCMRDCSAVTGACLLIKKELYDKVGGMDEKFDLYYGDTDLCLKILDLGYNVVFTPFATLLHDGSTKTKEITKEAHFAVENSYDFIKKWKYLRNGDPFYSPNLGLDYKISEL